MRDSPRPTERRAISVRDYHRMIDAGIFHEDEHVELLEGELVTMAPQKTPHARVIQRLTAALVRALGEQYTVRVQLPLTLGTKSEPEPDLAVVRTVDAERPESHPTSALLVIEVASRRDSLRRDRLAKARIYARAGVAEYWIVNLSDRCVEVLRSPVVPEEALKTQRVVGERGVLRPASLRGVTVRVRDMLP